MAPPDGPRNGSTASAEGAVLRSVVEICAFACELAMLTVLAVAGWGLGSGGLMSIAFAVFYPALAILIWSVWMAPTSRRRLHDPCRLIAQIVLFVATAALAVAAQHPVLGMVFAAVAIAVFATTRWTRGPTGGGSAQAGSSSSS